MSKRMLIPEHEFSAAAALIELLHIHLREFEAVWREAKAASLELPECDDPDYNSLDTLGVHVLAAARGELLWCCQQLKLATPDVDNLPQAADLADTMSNYLLHLEAVWSTPFMQVPARDFFVPEYKTSWGVHYCIEAMFEHAVMHPIRHTHQLRKWLTTQHNSKT